MHDAYMYSLKPVVDIDSFLKYIYTLHFMKFKWMLSELSIDAVVFVPNFCFCLPAINIETFILHVKTVNQTSK